MIVRESRGERGRRDEPSLNGNTKTVKEKFQERPGPFFQDEHKISGSQERNRESKG